MADIHNVDNLPSGFHDPRKERADKSSWVGIVSAFLLFGREISGTRVTRDDVSGAIDVAEQLYNETTAVCHAPPTRAL